MFAGAEWRVVAAVRHVGASAAGGQYFAIVDAGSPYYRLAGDARISGPMLFADAWQAIGREPSVMFCAPVAVVGGARHDPPTQGSAHARSGARKRQLPHGAPQ